MNKEYILKVIFVAVIIAISFLSSPTFSFSNSDSASKSGDERDQEVVEYFLKQILRIGYSCPNISRYAFKGNTTIGSEYMVYCGPDSDLIYKVIVRRDELWVEPQTEKAHKRIKRR